ncbi:MAG: RNA 2',3'-cyclic phosphodiesterase [Candidatus Micrarchaeota archaeon]
MNEKRELRLFVSVEVPQEIRKKVALLAKELPEDSIKPVMPENMHLTLKFIGETSEEKLEEIKEALRQISFSPFKCRINGVGVFPNEDYIRVVWAGVESPELDSLAKDVISALVRFGGDSRFSAHLTLARVRKKIDVREFVANHKDDEFGEFEVNGFQLMKSMLSREGPAYSVVARFPG